MLIKTEECTMNVTEFKKFLREEGASSTLFKGKETETFRQYHVYYKGVYQDTITFFKNEKNKFEITWSNAEHMLSHIKLFG